MPVQRHRSKVQAMGDRTAEAASAYDPIESKEHPETNVSSQKLNRAVQKISTARSMNQKQPPKKRRALQTYSHKQHREKMMSSTYGTHKKNQQPRTTVSIVDKGTVKRYQRLQAASLEYMHLIEQEARKVLEVQQQVMEESLHLEHIRKEYGGYCIPTTALNSGERGSKEAIAKEKAFFERHIANLESELVAANTLVSKDIIMQDHVRMQVNEQRHLIVGKKQSLLLLNQSIHQIRKDCVQFHSDIHDMQHECVKETTKIERMKQHEKVRISKTAKDIQKVHAQKIKAAATFKNNMTFSKQEVERQRRAVTMERLKTIPKRPHTSQGGHKGRLSLRARVGTSKTATKEQRLQQRRPRTAAAATSRRSSRGGGVVNKAEIMKGSRNSRRPSSSHGGGVGSGSRRRSSTGSSLLFANADANANENAKEKDTAVSKLVSKPSTTSPTSPARKRKSIQSPPPSLKPTYENDPHAKHDVTKHPKLWMPGRPQQRVDPSADHNPESKNIPSPLGRRGSLVGRNPARFGSPGKLSGRLELLLSTLPEIENKKKLIKQRGAAMSWQLARKQLAANSVEESIEELEKLFEKISQKTGIDTIEQFADVFMTSEARQFVVVEQVEASENALSSIRRNNTHMISEIEKETNKLNNIQDNSLFSKITNEIHAVQLQEQKYRKQLIQKKGHIKACVASVELLLYFINSKDAREVTGNDGKYIDELLL